MARTGTAKDGRRAAKENHDAYGSGSQGLNPPEKDGNGSDASEAREGDRDHTSRIGESCALHGLTPELSRAEGVGLND